MSVTRKQPESRNEIWEFGGEISEAFESTDLGQAVSADVDDISGVLTNHILNKLIETYELAGDISKENPKNHFSTFQGLLRDFKDWDSKTQKKFSRQIKKTLSDIDVLIRSSIVGVSQIRFIWLAKTKGLSKRECNRVLQAISISRIIPCTEDFLHWCCCRSVAEVYQHPYLFDNRKNVSKRKKQENIKTVKNIINKAINDEIYSRENATHIIKSALGYVKGGSYILPEKYEVDDMKDDSDDDEEKIEKESDLSSSSLNIKKDNISSDTLNMSSEKDIKEIQTSYGKQEIVNKNDMINIKNNVKMNEECVENEHYFNEKVNISKSHDKSKNTNIEKINNNNNKKTNKIINNYKLDSDNLEKSSYGKKNVIKQKKDNVVYENDYNSDDSETIYLNENSDNQELSDNGEDHSSSEIEPDGEEEEKYWSSLRNNLKMTNKKNNKGTPQIKQNSKKKYKDKICLSSDESEDYISDDENKNRDDTKDYDDIDDDGEGDNSADDDGEGDNSDDDGEGDNDDDGDDDDDDDDDDKNSFWKTLQDKAEKQLGYGKVEEDKKNKSKNKTLTSYSSSNVKKSKKEIKSENLKKKTKNIKNITCDDLEMLDNVNSDDGVDLESEVE